MKKPVIGTMVLDGKERPAVLDVQAMLATHMAVVASSGGGKSYLLRKLLEETFGVMPHLVIDVEGELKTLREKFDYLIASADGEGDCLAHPRSAKLLAKRLLELNVSCIIDIYELEPDEKVLFVRDFIHTLVNAPKELWGQRLVVIDEAHQFVPQNNERGMASRAAVISLLDKGRKRGLSTILATQRLSKVSKDALGECRNKLYGFCNLPADRKRATEDLGFLAKADQELFRNLDTGHFYAVGPAISKKDVVMVAVSKVTTTHPRPGDGIAAVTPPATAKVQKLIEELRDLPAQAKKEAEDLQGAQTRIKELERLLKATPKPVAAPVVDEKALRAVRAEVKAMRDALDLSELRRGQLLNGYKEILNKLPATKAAVVEAVDQVKTLAIVALKAGTGKPVHVPGHNPPIPADPIRAVGVVTGRTRTDLPNISNKPKTIQITPQRQDLPGAEARILDGLAWWSVVGVHQPTRLQVAFAARYTVNGHFNNTLGALSTKGLIRYPDRGLVELTDEGKNFASAPDSPPTAEELQDMVRAKLDGPAAKLFDVLVGAYPNAVSRDELASSAGYTVNGHFNNTLGSLHSMGAAEYPGRGLVQASKILFLEN